MGVRTSARGAGESRAVSTARVVASFSVVFALFASLAACGKATRDTEKAGARHDAPALGTEPPGSQKAVIAPAARRQVVATVGHHRITRAYLEEWTPLEVLFASPYKSGSSVPSGLVPDPPSYRRCIAYLMGTSGRAAGRPSQQQLKRQCESKQEYWVRFTLSHLIKYAWLYEEAAKMGVKVSPADVQRLIAASNVKPAVLKALGVPPSYQDFVAGAEAISGKVFLILPLYKRKVRETNEGHRETTQTALAIDKQFYTWYDGISTRWTPKTSCDPEYVVWGCSEYSQEEARNNAL